MKTKNCHSILPFDLTKRNFKTFGIFPFPSLATSAKVYIILFFINMSDTNQPIKLSKNESIKEESDYLRGTIAESLGRLIDRFHFCG